MSTATVEEVTAVTGAEGVIRGRTPWQLFWGRFRQDRLAFVGLGIIVFMVVLALVAPLIAARSLLRRASAPCMNSAVPSINHKGMSCMLMDRAITAWVISCRMMRSL